MLIISRSQGEAVRIGNAVVRVGEIADRVVKLVIEAPRSTPIVREELLRNVVACQPLRHVLADATGGRRKYLGWIH